MPGLGVTKKERGKRGIQVIYSSVVFGMNLRTSFEWKSNPAQRVIRWLVNVFRTSHKARGGGLGRLKADTGLKLGAPTVL